MSARLSPLGENVFRLVLLGACAALLVALYIGVRSQTGGSAQAQQGQPVPPESMFGVARSDEQNAILADGVVTEAEVRAALNSAADCLEAHGVQAVRVGDPHLEGHLVLGAFTPDGGDHAKTSAAVDQCGARYSAAVTSAWRAQNRGSDSSNPVLGADGWPLDPSYGPKPSPKP